MSTIDLNETPHPLPDQGKQSYDEMSVDELRSELGRLDGVCIMQNIKLRKLHGVLTAVISDFSPLLVAHMKGDTQGVASALDELCKTRVTVAAPGSMEVH